MRARRTRGQIPPVFPNFFFATPSRRLYMSPVWHWSPWIFYASMSRVALWLSEQRLAIQLFLGESGSSGAAVVSSQQHSSS